MQAINSHQWTGLMQLTSWCTTVFFISSFRTDLQQNDLFYSMKKPDRGLAIVLSHEFYDKIDGKGVPVRSGTSNDVERLKDTLSDLGFQVDVKKDLTHKEICRLISNGTVHCSYVTENLVMVITPAFLAWKPTGLYHVFH
jgi:hypothetical protein